MIYILTPEQMSQADRCAIENIGIPSLVLMENAIKSVFDIVHSLKPTSVLVIANTGNNGADAIGVARWCFQHSIDVDILITKSQKQTQEFKTQLQIAKSLGINIYYDFPTKKYDVIIDGLFGTGFKPPVREEFIPYIDFINNSKAIVVSVDIPSGIPSEHCVKADYTVSFSNPKTYHIQYPYSKYCGIIYIKDISIPNICIPNKDKILLSIKDIKPLIPKRALDTHKGEEGKILLIGGNIGYTGAITMSAKASTKAGASLVFVGVPKENISSVSGLLVEQIKYSLPSKDGFITSIENINLEEFDAIGIGMGFGIYEEGLKVIEYIVNNFNKPILIDADGLNIISKYKALGLLEKENIVITPHIGEFSRLTGFDKDYIIKNQIDVALDFHRKYKCSIALKSAISVIGIEDKAYVSMRGSPAMAKGGTGDVLSGILTTFLSKMSISKALKLGVFLHGIAGETASSKTHMESMSVMDMIESIPEAFRYIENAKDHEVCARLYIENTINYEEAYQKHQV